MIENIKDKKKLVIGLYGEMQLAMILHEKGWQVHRSYIDEGLDFVISKYFCKNCNKYTNQLIKNEKYNNKTKKCVTNLCNFCKTSSLKIITRYLQVKTSEGVNKEEKNQNDNIRIFSFHPKIRYDIGNDVFYVWIAIFPNNILNNKKSPINIPIIHYYIFNTKELSKFYDTSIASYQITDNEKLEFPINTEGEILKIGSKYIYDCFKEFWNNFDCLDKLNEFEKLEIKKTITSNKIGKFSVSSPLIQS